MIVHQIEALRDAGVTEVVLAINYQPQVMYSFIEEYQSKLGVKITISQARGAAARAPTLPFGGPRVCALWGTARPGATGGPGGLWPAAPAPTRGRGCSCRAALLRPAR